MTTNCLTLPIIDLLPLASPSPNPDALLQLSQQLDHVFSTVGFAYLVNHSISFCPGDVFKMTRDFFSLPAEEMMKLAKQTFAPKNGNTYRGYFPPQPGQLGNLKEGFEMGPPSPVNSLTGSKTFENHAHALKNPKFNLTEPNVWPSSQSSTFSSNSRARLEHFYIELQSLSARLLELLAVALGQVPSFFADYLDDSLSTLRLLHYPLQPASGSSGRMNGNDVRLCCTPHTNSGILTLQHQDPTAPGLEVLDANSEWIPAPYVPESIVVNIGDLMGMVSGGRWAAMMHRVRTSESEGAGDGTGFGRLSVPFFFEPGEGCVIKPVVATEGGGVKYGDHLRRKMAGWVEFQHMLPGLNEGERGEGAG